MKEIKFVNLTSRAQKPYSGYGDKIMSMEGQSDMSHQDSESTNPNRVENSQAKRSISPEEKQRIDKAWQIYNGRRTSKGDQPNVDELHVQDMLKQKGYMPPLTQDARDLLRNVESGGTPAFISSKLKRILRENGISQKDIDSKTPQELIKMLTENRVSEQNDESPKAEVNTAGEAGRGGGERPPNPPGGQSNQQSSSGENNDSNNDEKAGEGEERSQRDAIKGIIEKHKKGTPERKEAIAELLKQFSPLGTYVPEILVDYSLEYDDVFESLVNRIVSLPLDKETSDYNLGLYASSNLETMSDRVTQSIDKASDNLSERERLRGLKDRLTLAQESSALIHNMNKLVVTGEMEGFIRTAEGITPEHLNYLQKLDGVGIAMQVYDEVYQKYLAKYGWIYSFVAKELHREVFNRLNDYNGKKVFGERRLEEWELRRAYNVGRKFFNTSFRSAELVATGTVPTDEGKKLIRAELEEKEKQMGYARKLGNNNDIARLKEEIKDRRETLKVLENRGKQRYSSFPLESAARIMNPIQLTVYRFIMAENRGAQEFLKKAKLHYQEYLRRNGDKANINKIITLGGINVEQMEYGSAFATSGIYSSWRNENFFLSQMSIVVNGESTTVREWLSNNAYEIENAKAAGDSIALAKIFEPLTDNAHAGLGVLLKQGVLGGKVAYETRKQLWGKVLLGKRYEGTSADTSVENNPEIGNLPLLINYLSKVETKDNLIESIEKIKERARPVNTQENYWNETSGGYSRWDTLMQKINIQHTINIKRSVGRLSGAQSPEFTNEEKELIKAIKIEGKKLPEHLADIAFPYTPFMNDAPFEVSNYEVAGAEFYRRRAAGDIPSYFNAAKAFMAIVDNPGGMGVEEAIKQFHELERGIESPQGSEDAQQRTFPLFEAWMDWVMTKPGERYAVLKSLKQTLQKPTSDAQKWSGMGAPTVNEKQARDLVEQAVLAGILNAKLGEELKKEKNIKFLGIFWMFFRDVFTTVIPALTVYTIGREIASLKN